MRKRQPELKVSARLILFLVSYIPLFLIMLFSQFYKYKGYLNYGGINNDYPIITLKRIVKIINYM